MATWQGWEQQLLNAIGAPVTSENVSFLDKWANAEGGSAAYNPMNTTQPEPGATNYNSVGVKEFGNAAQGIDATAKTLTNGYYPDILAGLKSGDPFAHITDSFKKELDIWGTGSGFLGATGSPAPSPSSSASDSAGSPNPSQTP